MSKTNNNLLFISFADKVMATANLGDTEGVYVIQHFKLITADKTFKIQKDVNFSITIFIYKTENTTKTAFVLDDAEQLKKITEAAEIFRDAEYSFAINPEAFDQLLRFLENSHQATGIDIEDGWSEHMKVFIVSEKNNPISKMEELIKAMEYSGRFSNEEIKKLKKQVKSMKESSDNKFKKMDIHNNFLINYYKNIYKLKAFF